MLVERIASHGLKAAAQAAGISLRTAREWQRRFALHGAAALADCSSRPVRTRSTIDAREVAHVAIDDHWRVGFVQVQTSFRSRLQASSFPTR